MSCFLLPNKLIKDITTTIRKFWWSSVKDKHKIPWIPWSKITDRKIEGGLGFRDFKCFNLALVAKQSWRILRYPHSLLAKVYKAKYFSHNSLLDANLGSSPSYAWRSIYAGGQSIKHGLRWNIGNGKKVRIWEDNWLPTNPPRPPRRLDESIRVADFKVADLFQQNRSQWDNEKLQRLIHPEDVPYVSFIRPSLTNANDVLTWIHSKTGEYTVRSGYYYIKQECVINPDHRQDSQNQENQPVYKALWSLKIPPKLKIFWWKALNNGLPVASNLKRRQLLSDDLCWICGEQPEDINHLLFLCRVAKEIWDLSPINFEPGLRFNSNILVNNVKHILSLSEPMASLGVFIGWRIWKMRNVLIFENNREAIPDTIRKACYDHQIWIKSLNMLPNALPFTNICISNNLQAPMVKFTAFVDGSWKSADDRAGIGWVLKDDQNRQILYGMNSIDPSLSPIEVEALALREAVLRIKNLGYKDVCFHGDSSAIYNFMASTRKVYGYTRFTHNSINVILEDIMKIALPTFRFNLIKRSDNSTADVLAKEARRLSSKCKIVWV